MEVDYKGAPDQKNETGKDSPKQENDSEKLSKQEEEILMKYFGTDNMDTSFLENEIEKLNDEIEKINNEIKKVCKSSTSD